jgi:hypothetical protein
MSLWMSYINLFEQYISTDSIKNYLPKYNTPIAAGLMGM